MRRWVGGALAGLVALGLAGAVGGDRLEQLGVPAVELPSVRGLPSWSPSAGKAEPTGPVVQQLEALATSSERPEVAYERELFGQRWADVDRNGCDTRNDVLRRDLTGVMVKPGTGGCKVLSGELVDPYSGAVIEFSSQDPQAVQIDHAVSLADAWDSGAWAWDAGRREQFANDPDNLLAVDGPANQSKGDATAAEWLPTTSDGRCELVRRQVAVKIEWGLSVSDRERAAMRGVLEVCPEGS